LKQVDKLKFKETINDEYRRILKMKDLNMRGKDIEKLNNQLSKIYPTTKFSKDLYDQTTESMVKLFQYSNQLDVDGIVGPITWDKLFSYIYVEWTHTIEYDPNKEDEYSDVVKLIQDKIKKNALKFTISELSHDGYYDKTTYNNIRKIKSIMRYPINGDIDKETYDFFLNL